MKYLDVPQSGSIAATVHSRNRYGQYTRNRSSPVNPNSSYQGVVRARLSQNAAAWRALTSTQRTGWAALGAQIVRTDSLGQSYTLNGFGAYCSVNNNKLAAGDAVVSDAPALATPTAITTATITLTAAAFSIAYTPTPLAAGTRLFSFLSPQVNAGRSFMADLRLVAVSAAAAASPANVFTAYQTRLGTPVVGNRIFFALVTYFGGFVSGPLVGSQVVA